MRPDRREEFTVRFPNPAGSRAEPPEVQVRGTVDRVNKTVTFELPDRTRTTIDVVTARALQMILWEAVFGALQPVGPRLQVEKRLDGESAAALPTPDVA